MKLDVLAIGAHPDDVELTCGGTIAKLVKQGRKVGICDLTAGELGTRGTPEIRAKEAKEASRVLGISIRTALNIPDGNIEQNLENKLKIVRVIRKHQPDVLLIPYHHDRHPDHEHTHRLCRDAMFAAGLEKVRTMDGSTPQPAFRPRKYYCFMQWFEFTPSFVVDISEEYEQRMKAVRAYASQFHDPASKDPETVLSDPAFMEMIRTRLEYYGDRIGVKYGEPFFTPEILGVGNLDTFV